jgi:hypothetical protein
MIIINLLRTRFARRRLRPGPTKPACFIDNAYPLITLFRRSSFPLARGNAHRRCPAARSSRIARTSAGSRRLSSPPLHNVTPYVASAYVASDACLRRTGDKLGKFNSHDITFAFQLRDRDRRKKDEVSVFFRLILLERLVNSYGLYGRNVWRVPSDGLESGTEDTA